MRLLAFDTSGPVLTVGAYDAGKEKASWDSEPSARHSGSLHPAIEKVLRQAGWRLADLEGIAVGIGPGSFTGLRVGLAAAKTMAYVLKIKIAGIPSLEAFAFGADVSGPVAATLDAKRGMIYGGIYEKAGTGLRVVAKPALMKPELFSKKAPKGTFFMGSGMPGSPEARVTARAVAALGEIAFAKKKVFDAASLLPLYLSPKDCNVTLPGKKRK